MNAQTAIDDYVNANSRSPAVAFLGGLVFGPIGVMYSSAMVGSMLLIVAIVGAILTGPMIPMVIWLISVIYAPMAASNHNDRIRANAQLIAFGRKD